MPKVVALENVNALRSMQLVDFLRRAFEQGPIAPFGLDSIARDLFHMIKNPNVQILIGAEEGDFAGLTIVTLPQDNISPFPFIIHFYCEGSAELRKMLMKELFDFIVQRGYTKAWAINGTQHIDAAWEKVLVPAGATSTKIGTIFQLEVT